MLVDSGVCVGRHWIVMSTLCALMWESQRLCTIFIGKTSIVYYFMIGKTHSQTLKVFHELQKLLSLGQHKIFGAEYEVTRRMNWEPLISNEIVILCLDFSGFSSWRSTSSNSSSELPTSLRMSRHVFNTYSARSRDSRGPYTAKFAPRDRKHQRK